MTNTDEALAEVFCKAMKLDNSGVNKDILTLGADMTDYLIILSHFENDDWYDKYAMDNRLARPLRDKVRILVNYGILERANKPRKRDDGSSKKQKNYMALRLAPVITPILKGYTSPIEVEKDKEELILAGMIAKELFSSEEYDGNALDVNTYRHYLPYHLMRCLDVECERITTKQLDRLYPINVTVQRPKFNKKDLNNVMKDMGTSARLDLCEDVYRFILKSGNNGVTKREIINELWVKHAYEYTLQHIDTVCRILIKAGYVKEYDTTKEIVFCDISVRDEDIPKKERLVRTQEEQDRDEYLVMKVMEQCETSYRYKDIENYTGINASAVRRAVLSLVEKGLILRIEDGIDAVSFSNLDYEGLCREVREKEIEYGMVKDNGHTYIATETPEETNDTIQTDNVPMKEDNPVETDTNVITKDNVDMGIGEYDYPTALTRMYDGIAVVSMATARVYHLIADKGLRCADDINEPITSFTKEEKNCKWRDMPDIKECPCCKSQSHIKFNDERTEYWCECDKCHISTRHEQSIITAIGTWNTRA